MTLERASTWNGASTRAGTVDLTTDGDRCVLTLSGEFDLESSDRIVEGLRQALVEPVEEIDLDLAEVTLLSSAAVASLLQAASLADQRHRRLLLVAVSPTAERVLDVLGLTRFFVRS